MLTRTAQSWLDLGSQLHNPIFRFQYLMNVLHRPVEVAAESRHLLISTTKKIIGVRTQYFLILEETVF